MSHPRHWSYYMSLEDDLIETGRYVEICEDNFDTYSIHFTRLLLAAASEVDVVAKMLCCQINPQGCYRTINNYRDTIVPQFPAIPSIVMGIQWTTNIRVKPWGSWAESPPKNPDWWHAYNRVKHKRNSNFKEANLRNALTAIAGLYCLVRHLQQDVGRPRPERFLKIIPQE